MVNTPDGGRAGRSSYAAVVIQPRFVVQAMGWVVVAIAAVVVIARSSHVLELVALAVAIAVVLRAPIEALSRTLPRGLAVFAVVIGAIASLAALIAIGTIELREEIDVVGSEIEQRIDQVDADSALGEFLADAHVAERIQERLDRVPSQIMVGSADSGDGARRGLEALLVVVLVVYALVNGPSLARSLLGGESPRWWARYVREGVAAGAAQVRHLLAMAVIGGLVALATASAFGLAGKSVLAIWAGVWAVVPIFGPLIGFAPLVVVASLDGLPQALGIVLIAAAVSAASWFADQRGSLWSSARRVDAVGPLALVVALVIGLQFNWLLGPFVAVFVMAASVPTLAALGRRERTRVLADQPTVDAAEPVRGNVWGRLDRRSASRATAIVVIAVAAIMLVRELAPVPVWLVVGITLAIALDPLVGWIADHSPLGRGASIGAVVVGLVALVVALLVFAVPSVNSSIRDLDAQLPKIAADLEQLPLIGDQLAERGVAATLQDTVEELPSRLASDTGPAERTLRSLGDGLVATFWILLITVAALIDGGRVRQGLRALVAPERGPEFDRVTATVSTVIARYAVGSLVIAAIAGSAVFAIAVIAGVPLAALLGLWAAVTNFVPQVGGYLGGAPLVVLGFTTGTTKGLVIAVSYIVYMQVENRVIQPLIVSKAVGISPFVAMVAVLVGAAAAGVVGAVLITPLVAVVIALRREARRSATDQIEHPSPQSAHS
jgi:predicted PurR-regulated permease PerM